MTLRIRRVATCAAIAIAWLPAATRVAHGQSRAAAPADSEARLIGEAKDLFVIATREYDAGAFDRAARAFQASLALADRASTRYNLARTVERMGRTRQAVVEYEAYLASSPDANDASEVRAAIERLGGPTLPPTAGAVAPPADKDVAAPGPAVPGADRPGATVLRLPAPGPLDLRPEASPPPPTAARVHLDRAPAYVTLAIGTVAALGVALLGASAIEARVALARSSVREGDPADRRGAAKLADRLHADALAADVLGLTALGALGAGTWMFLDPPAWWTRRLEDTAGAGGEAPGTAGR